ncbi:MAG: carbamoyl-phosphate synthase L chain ATP-binding protein [Gammaproteobacteria bacterium]|nr:carbamoyl-phosphate synthase L chain ATP-binding protein [Gammaproteobacteria bacterium]
MFDSILVANRGEIALRIMRTAQAMGIQTIAIYVEADKDAPHVRFADKAVLLPDGGYLDIDAVLDAAQKSGAGAIHPGYGFLSENSEFAKRVIKEKIVWVGPSPKVISVMGDKLKAKELAIKASVPTLPMTSNEKEVKNIGYPLLIKAAAGGGGKGMRVVTDKKDLQESLEGAKREALSGFGDERVFIERYVEKSRHIEIQILGDSHGNVIHLGERECSIQRRHQKIIEESPSPRITEEIRFAMGNAAVDLAKKIKYESAGTVEFLFDDKSGEFWFLEVNTRLQVEHPVTEEVTGIDLVAEQLKIARGEELQFSQEDIEWTGSSIEARLYAENPNNDFLPETGKMFAYEQAENDFMTRWDSGVHKDSVIGTNFDPMLAKVISYGETREDAARVLAKSLEDSHIGGVITNKDFLIATLRSDEFLKGNTTTDFIERVKPPRVKNLTNDELNLALTTAAMWKQMRNRISSDIAPYIPSGWTNGRLPNPNITFLLDGDEIFVEYKLINKNKFLVFNSEVEVVDIDDKYIDLVFDGVRVKSRISEDAEFILVHIPSGDVSFEVKPRFSMPGLEVQAGGLVAPMPGKVVDLKVKKGSKVKSGETLVILEAMKMEHSIKASEDGVISDIFIKENDQVENGAVLMVVDS